MRIVLLSATKRTPGEAALSAFVRFVVYVAKQAYFSEMVVCTLPLLASSSNQRLVTVLVCV